MIRRMAMVIAFSITAPWVAADDDVIIFRAEPPARQTPGRPAETKALPAVADLQQRTLGAGPRAVVTISLDNTGISDWSFMNPRRPREIALDTNIEFYNQTADRRFEVSTAVTVTRADLILLDPTATSFPTSASATGIVRNAIDVLRGATQLAPALITENITLQDVASYTNTTDARAEALKSVAEVDAKIQELAKERAEEAKARKALDEALADSKTPTETIRNLANSVATEVAEREQIEAAIRTNLAAAQKHRAALAAEIKRDKAEYERQLVRLRGASDRARTSAERVAAETRAQEVEAIVQTFDTAIFVLESQSEDTPILLAARQRLGSVLLEDCAVTGTALGCNAVIRLQPNDRDSFPREVLLLQTDRTAAARFTVKFFQELETPANQTAYLVATELKDKLAPPKSVATLSAVAGIGGAIDPFYEPRTDPALSLNCPILYATFPYVAGHKKHLNGTGSVTIKQTFGNLLDGNVKIAFKSGDLGGGTKTVDVALSQYQFRIFSATGLQFHFGKFPFAAPSSKIAINESGEGFRFLWNSLAVSHVTKRESAAETANRANRDSYVWIVEYANVDVSPLFPFRKLSLIGLDGLDAKPPEEKAHPILKDLKRPVHTAREYRTFGGEATYGFPRWRIWGTVAGYWSERKARERGQTCGGGLIVCDGRGQVGLLTVTRPIGTAPKITRTVTATFGLGSADNPSTLNRDESYSGETAAFVPDQIFLAGLATSVSGRDYVDPTNYLLTDATPEEQQAKLNEFAALDIGILGLGAGLGNKRYFGVKYADENFSLLEALARGVFRIPPSDIKSRATRVTFNHYRLRSDFLGSKNAGHEIDFEFEVESPKGVKVTLSAGYFWPGSAIKPVVKKNVWTATSLISISL
jgi:hypothetical protein